MKILLTPKQIRGLALRGLIHFPAPAAIDPYVEKRRRQILEATHRYRERMAREREACRQMCAEG